MKFTIITLFPESVRPLLDGSVLGKAQQRGSIEVHTVSPRQFAEDKHRTTDEPPFGGGEGMVFRPDVLYAAWQSVGGAQAFTIYLSPQAPLDQVLTQDRAKSLFGRLKKSQATELPHLILVCGHYEGIDERFIELCVDEEWSIGDYILTGGEVAAVVFCDVLARLIPGVVGNEDSVKRDTFEGGLLKYPQYTRPREFRGIEVPSVLLSGHHQKVQKWRELQSEERTRLRRPDLWSQWIQSRHKK